MSRAADAFEKVEYGLLTWNCHSFLAAFLNAIEHTPEGQPGSFGLLRTWTVAGVGLRLFLHAHYVHGRRAGWMQQWGGTAAVTWCVLWLGVWHGVWDLAKLWLLLLVSVNGFFVAWFGALAFLRLDSQRGFVPEGGHRRRNLGSPACSRRHTDKGIVAKAAGRHPSSLCCQIRLLSR